MNLVELLHELAAEDSYAGAHGHEVDREGVLHDDGQGEDEAPEDLLGNLVFGLGNAHDLHLCLLIFYQNNND